VRLPALIADGDREVADFDGGRIAQFQGGDVGLRQQFEQPYVEIGVDPDDFRLDARAVVRHDERTLHPFQHVRGRHDVVIGDAEAAAGFWRHVVPRKRQYLRRFVRFQPLQLALLRSQLPIQRLYPDVNALDLRGTLRILLERIRALALKLVNLLSQVADL